MGWFFITVIVLVWLLSRAARAGTEGRNPTSIYDATDIYKTYRKRL